MDYSFNVEMAVKYGVEEAVLLNICISGSRRMLQTRSTFMTEITGPITARRRSL